MPAPVPKATPKPPDPSSEPPSAPSKSERTFGEWFADTFIGSRSRGQVRYLNYFGMVVWGLVVVAFGIALFSAIVNLWPVVDVTPPSTGGEAATAAVTDKTTSVAFFWGLFSLNLTKSTGLIVLAILAGALGGWTTAIRLFAFWAGERKLKSTWAWWFGNRVFGGAALALIVYLVIRAGLFGTENATGDVNAYGTAAFAALTGLFSRQGIRKLQQVFDTFFQKTDEEGDLDDGEAADIDQGQPTAADIAESRGIPKPAEGSGKAEQKGAEAGK